MPIPTPPPAYDPGARRQLEIGYRELNWKSRFEDFRNSHAETGQMRLGRQLLTSVELLRLHSRSVEVDRAKNGIDYPYQRNASVKIFLYFFSHFLVLVRRRQNLDCQYRRTIDQFGFWGRRGCKLRGDIGDIDSHGRVRIFPDAKASFPAKDLASGFRLLHHPLLEPIADDNVDFAMQWISSRHGFLS